MKSSMTKIAHTLQTKKRPIKKRPSPLRKPKLRIRRLLYIYLGCIVFSAMVAGLIATKQHTAALPDPFSSEQRAVAPFKLYYPSRLPERFYIDTASLSRLEQSVVVLRITNGAGKGQVFTLSQQALPDQTNLETFYQSFGGRITFDTNVGKATAGTIDDGTTRLVSVVTPDSTWILIQAPTIVSLDTLQASLSSLVVSR